MGKMILKSSLSLAIIILLISCAHQTKYPILDHDKLANEYFHEDAQWYLDNIPFFECSDKKIEQVYYNRWKMYKAHIRHVGDNSYVITEFINHVAWDRDPYCTINAATMHHIYEGRWIKDPGYMDSFGKPREISSVKIYLYADDKTFAPPNSISIEVQNGDKWTPVKIKDEIPGAPIGNTVNTINFDKVTASRIRINFKHDMKQVAVSEVECY